MLIFWVPLGRFPSHIACSMRIFLWLDAYPSFGVIQKNPRGGGRKYTFLTIIQMLNLYFRTCTIGLRKKSGAICSGHIITECHSGLILHKSSFMHAWYVIKAKFAHISILYIPGYLRYTTPKSSWKKKWHLYRPTFFAPASALAPLQTWTSKVISMCVSKNSTLHQS